MSDAAVIKRLSARIETLEAELAAERLVAKDNLDWFNTLKFDYDKTEAERDALRELLKAYGAEVTGLRARIDAALKGDGDAS